MSSIFLKRTLSLCLFAACVMAFILMLSSQASAECSGTCPPPVTGDWLIGTNTVLANETIVMDGDVTVQSLQSLTLKNVTITMDQPSISYIWVKANANLQMLDSEVLVGQNVYFVRVEGFANIDNSLIQGANSTVFTITTDPASRINGTTFKDSVNEGLSIGASITVANSTFQANGKNGFRVTEGSPIIENCLVKENGNYGVYVSDGAPIIENSTITENGDDGIFVVWGSPTISNSLITENGDNGVVSTSGSPSVIGNTVSSNSGVGIYSSGGNPFVEGNTISDNLNYGLYFISSTPTISGNTISGNADKGIVIMDTQQALLENNDVSDFERGIQLQNATAVLRNCTIGSATSIYDILLFEGSSLHAINTTFESYNVYYHEAASELRVSWFLDVDCLDDSGSSVAAWLNITDVGGVFSYSKYLDSGSADMITLTEYLETSLARSDLNPYTLETTGAGLTVVASHSLQTSENITIPMWNTPPTSPQLLAPMEHALIVSLAPEFQWTAATDPNQWDSVASYTLEYTTDPAFLTGIKTIEGITSTTQSAILQDSQTYYWWVNAVDTHGAEGAFSTANSFDIEVGQGTNLDPPTIRDTLPTSLAIASGIPYTLDLAPHLEDDEGIENLFISVDKTWISVLDQTLTFLSVTERIETATITVTDGLSAVQASINVTVSSNIPPVLNATRWSGLNLTFDEDTSYTLDLRDYFTDVDGSLSFSFAKVGGSNITADNPGGNFVYIFTAKEDWSGTETVTFRVFDSGGGFTEGTLTLFIDEVNDEPLLTRSLPSLTIQEGVAWALDLDDYFEDVDGPVMIFICSNSLITIDPVTHIAQWSPTYDTDKLTGVTFSLSDGVGTPAISNSIDITVSRPSNIFFNPLIWMVLIGSIVGEVGAVLLYRKLKYAYSIGEVFLLDKYGMLMLHIPINTEIVVDEDIMGAMLTAVQQFVADSLGKAGDDSEGDHLGKLEYGDLQICMEAGEYVTIASIISGHAATSLYNKMEKAIQQIELGNELLLEDWGGLTENVAYAENIVRDVLLDKQERKASDKAKLAKKKTRHSEIQSSKGNTQGNSQRNTSAQTETADAVPQQPPVPSDSEGDAGEIPSPDPYSPPPPPSSPEDECYQPPPPDDDGYLPPPPPE